MTGGAAALTIASSLLALCAGAPVRAQVDTKSTAPIDVTANEAEVVNSKCVVIWRGAAEALQDQTRLRADTISVYAHPKAASAGGQAACGGTDRIEAEGHVFYVTPQQNARGDHAVYSAAADQIVITGDVILVQGKDVGRGDKLTLEVATREAKLESNAVGAGKPGRVRAVYYPDTSGQSAGSAKP